MLQSQEEPKEGDEWISRKEKDGKAARVLIQRVSFGSNTRYLIEFTVVSTWSVAPRTMVPRNAKREVPYHKPAKRYSMPEDAFYKKFKKKQF